MFLLGAPGQAGSVSSLRRGGQEYKSARFLKTIDPSALPGATLRQSWKGLGGQGAQAPPCLCPVSCRAASPAEVPLGEAAGRVPPGAGDV